MILGGFGFMLGTGGTAIVAKTMGLGERDRANEYFTFIIIATAVGGVILAILGIIFIEPIAILFGAEGEMLMSPQISAAYIPFAGSPLKSVIFSVPN